MGDQMNGFLRRVIRAIRVLRTEHREFATSESLGVFGGFDMVGFWHKAIVTFGVALFEDWAKVMGSGTVREGTILEKLESLGRMIHASAPEAELRALTVDIWQQCCLLPGEVQVLSQWGKSVLERERNRSGLCATADCAEHVSVEETWAAVCKGCQREIREEQEDGDKEIAKLSDEEIEEINEDSDRQDEFRTAAEEAIGLEIKGKKLD